ncbi:LuxR C-terminal-related transcriptional regulator [Streptomyces collinus]|uniref:LuxR C-terminal-related transcriptional regulator n=1 Tax=Streptomyces collinus TaxID=42684 RepID=UPI0036AFE8E6
MPSRWPLAGRESELQAFEWAWKSPRCQAVVIAGPAGVGKSRLAEEFLKHVVRSGWKGAQVTATAAAAAVPLSAIAHLIPAGVNLSDPVRGFAQVAQSLAGPRRDRRRAVLIDDLHLLDATSAVLLRQLLDTGMVRLICTVRSEEKASDAVAALTGGERTYRIDVMPFDHHQLERVLQAGLGGPVGRQTMHRLHAASKGNALYLYELVWGALRAGTLASDGEIWELAEGDLQASPKLSELVDARLAAAPPAARPVLELLALCEPLPLADAQKASSHQTLTALENAGLVQAATDQRRTVTTLAHPLYGEALRSGISSRRRRELLLNQIERTRAYGARRREDAVHLASWQLAATGTADSNLLIQAATLAHHTHDYPRVISLLRAVPAEHHTIASWFLLAETQMEIGASDKAEEALREAAAQAQTESEKLAVVSVNIMNAFWANSNTVQALAVLDEAAKELRDSVSHRALRINEGWIRTCSGRPAEGLELLENVEMSEAHSSDINPWVIGGAIKTLALTFRGRAEDAVTWSRRAHDIHLQLDSESVFYHPSFQRLTSVVALSEMGNLAEAKITGERVFAEMAVVEPFLGLYAAFWVARTEYIAGHIAEARRWYAEAATLMRQLNHTRVKGLVLSGLAATAAVLGDVRIAKRTVAEAATQSATGILPGEERLGEAWLFAAHGRLADARSVLKEAAAGASDAGHLVSEALLLTDLARLGGVEDVAPRLSELADCCQGRLTPIRARFVTCLGDGEPDQLLACSVELEHIGVELMAAEAAAQAGAIYHRLGDQRQATAATNRSAHLAARCEQAQTPLLASPEASAPLTKRELEIARLAGSGIPSKLIAEKLHLSVRTVDNHLQHAYAKLGVTTRQQLAQSLNRDSQVVGR